MKDSANALKHSQASFAEWQVHELNILKFHYLVTLSLPEQPSYSALEAFITKALYFCILSPEVSDGGFLAIYALLRLHYLTIWHDDRTASFPPTTNSRILLQATMLARHLVACDTSEENRVLALLAARLHLNLGLGKCAFQLYSHTRCKEMLLDTLSPYVLSKISMTHPFDIKGYQAFSADEELAKVISTIERMERKTDSYIYVDMPSFLWDQASDALELKRKLNSSLTKHICLTERRRIARLKGESIESLARPDYKSKHFPSYSHRLIGFFIMNTNNNAMQPTSIFQTMWISRSSQILKPLIWPGRLPS